MKENLEVRPIVGGRRLVSSFATVRADCLSGFDLTVRLDAEERLITLADGVWVEVTWEILMGADWVGEVEEDGVSVLPEWW